MTPRIAIEPGKRSLNAAFLTFRYPELSVRRFPAIFSALVAAKC
jgi:hypothetical protein